jgi:hypothetical protein
MALVLSYCAIVLLNLIFKLCPWVLNELKVEGTLLSITLVLLKDKLRHIKIIEFIQQTVIYELDGARLQDVCLH